MDDQAAVIADRAAQQEEDPRPWVRNWSVVGAVQGDFGSPSAVAVVERVPLDGTTSGGAVAYHVRAAGEVDADTPIQDTARHVARLADRTGAGRVVLDGTVCGAPMLRVWDDAITAPRQFEPIRIGDREPPELGSTGRFALAGVSRLDLLGAVRVAHDLPGGLVYSRRALLARDALSEYTARPPRYTQDEAEWAPPPSWHLVIAMAIGVWVLMEDPPELRAVSDRSLDWHDSDRVRFDRRRTKGVPNMGRGEWSGIGERSLDVREMMRRARDDDPTPNGRWEFVWLD